MAPFRRHAADRPTIRLPPRTGSYTRRLGGDLASFRDRLAWRVLASVGGRWVPGLVAGQPRRGVAARVPARGRAGPGGPLADRGGEQVVQHLVRLRDVRLRDPFTAACTVAGAECRRNTSGEVVVPPVKPRAHRAACGTSASTARLCSSSQPAGRPSRAASTRSHASTDTAMTCWVVAAATGSAVRAHNSAIRASTCRSSRSSPASPITDGTRPASAGRPASEV